MKSYIALVDCNNFFASCERVFRPELENRPVLVLSSNDGCAIARSNEVKQIGIPMGAPYFTIKETVKKHNISVFSTNFALYGNFSARVMNCLYEYCNDVEIYSIDEAFMQLNVPDSTDITEYCQRIVNRVKQNTGIPISIGIANTKTLAKIASKYAKKHPENRGVKHLYSNDEIDDILSNIDIHDIWGIGFRLKDKLNREGILNALQLKQYNISFARKKYGVLFQKTVLELNGTACIKVDHFVHAKKTLVHSRSFAKDITQYNDLASAISKFVFKACQSLRKHKLKARTIIVFIRTNKHSQQAVQYRNYKLFTSEEYSSDTIHFTKIALKLLKNIFYTGLKYKKAGIMFIDIVPQQDVQFSLLKDTKYSQDNEELMKTLDSINNKFGDDLIHIATQVPSNQWRTSSQMRSPNYLSSWNELPMVK